MPWANWLYFQNLITPSPLLMIKMLSWKALFWALTFRFIWMHILQRYMFSKALHAWLFCRNVMVVDSYLWPWHVKMVIVVFFVQSILVIDMWKKSSLAYLWSHIKYIKFNYFVKWYSDGSVAAGTSQLVFSLFTRPSKPTSCKTSNVTNYRDEWLVHSSQLLQLHNNFDS